MSDFSGPSAGTMIVGQFVDVAFVAELADRTRTELTLLPPTDSVPDTPIELSPLNRETLNATVSTQTLDGDPAFQLKLSLPRNIYQQGERALLYFVITVVLLGLLISALVVWQLDGQVLRRLTRLGQEVQHIGRNPKIASVTVSGSTDEIDMVAQKINQTLEALSDSYDQLQATHGQLEQRVAIRTRELADSNAQLKKEVERRIMVEGQLREERKLLAQRVEQRTAALNRSNLELQLANQHKDSFLATMSHELRTPLNVVLVLAETLGYGIYG